MRRESLPLLLLVRVETAGNSGCCYCWSRGGRDGKVFHREERERERERERWCSHHVRLLSVGM
jgi:hypothetical protein